MTEKLKLSVGNEWYRVLSYPRYSRERVRSIISELSRCGITELINYGSLRLGKVNVVGRGHSSVIVLGRHVRYGVVAIKIRRVDSKTDSLITECTLMKRGYPVTPKVYYCSDDVIVREYVRGIELGELVDRLSNCVEASLLTLSVLTSALWLDIRSVDHKELSRPEKHIIISEGLMARVIDLESASLRFGHNVCRVASWLLLRRRLISKLCSNVVKDDEVINLLRSYKRNPLNHFIDLFRVISEYVVK